MGAPTAPEKSTPRCLLATAALKALPVPKRLVTREARGLRKIPVQRGGDSWARRPTARARSFSRAILARVAASRGRVKRSATASCGEVVTLGAGSAGMETLALTVST
jgi:hypothetical protein